MPRSWMLAGWSLALVGCATASPPASCARASVGVQVLGSGGPIPDDGRASSGYLVWSQGSARVLIDAGGGVFSRFGAAGGSLDDLELIGLSHLHADHAAELPAMLKGTFFGERREDLPIVGPAGNDHFPGLVDFLDALFGDRGAFRYLSWLLEDGVGRFSLVPTEVPGPTTAREAVPPFTASLDGGAVQVTAVPVEHGPVPALGFRVDLQGTSVAFTGDQNANNAAFETLANDVDLLVAHHAIPDVTDSVAHRLHRSPTEIANLARATNPRTVLLSHLMPRSLGKLASSRRAIEKATSADVLVAEDFMCIVLK